MTNTNAGENTSPGLDNLSYLLLQNGNSSLGLTTVEQKPEFQPYEEFYIKARFITGLFCYPVVCLIGLTGNAISILVLSRRNMYSSTSVFLIALGVSDSIKVRPIFFNWLNYIL